MKNQLRAIVVTDTHLYRLDEKFKLKKDPIAINDISSAIITEDTLCQLVILRLKNSESDFVFYIQSNDTSIDRVPELLANIYRTRVKYKNYLFKTKLKSFKLSIFNSFFKLIVNKITR